jgi:serine/threonine-protein kinase
MERMEDSWVEPPPPPPPKQLVAGDTIGEDLTVTGLLGEGGTATVYAAYHSVLRREVAVKMSLGPQHGAFDGHARLVREAQMCASVRDAHVPCIYCLDRLEDGTPFIVMEKIEGRSLAQTLAARRLSAREACAVTCELLDALVNVHAKGIVHRDIKPSNLMVHFPDGARPQLKLLDFGVGKVLGSERPDLPALTSAGALLGTPLYMAPEQVLATAVDTRADVYAAGAVLYEMLAGRAPFVGDSVGEIFAAVLRDEIPPLLTLNPSLPTSLVAVVDRALEKKPDQRYQSAQAMHHALTTAMADLDAEHSLPPFQRTVPAGADCATTVVHNDNAAVAAERAAMGEVVMALGAVETVRPEDHDPERVSGVCYRASAAREPDEDPVRAFHS